VGAIDRPMQLRHLALADEHIARGAQHIRDQEMRIADLDDRGQDARLARAILEAFLIAQGHSVSHRDHILEVLGHCSRNHRSSSAFYLGCQRNIRLSARD
jgi:hypothetical protein